MITPKEFRTWQASLGDGRIGAAEIGRQMGKSPDTISRWRNAGVPDDVEPIVRLAMSAITAGLAPWKSQ